MLLVLRHFLDRTRGQPFSFRLKVRYFRRGEDERAPYLLELLVAESPRWQETYFETLSTYRLSGILCRVKHRLPLLNTLKLGLDTPDGDMHDIFEDAPHLKCVDLGHGRWRVNWASLTILKTGEYFGSNDKLLSILGQAERLEKLAIYQSFDGGSALDQMTSLLSFPNLKVLIIVGFGLLSVLHTPSLEELYIDYFNELRMSHTIVISFLNRSSCRLWRLGLAECSAASLTDILQYTPDLVHLNLESSGDLVMFFGHLTFHRQQDKAPPARHLRSLEIMDTVLSEMEIIELAALLASRSKVVKASSGVTIVERLQRLSILGPGALGGYKRAVVESLGKQCAEQGVEFTVQPKSAWPYHDNISVRDW
jgi:hypothetical protein